MRGALKLPGLVRGVDEATVAVQTLTSDSLSCFFRFPCSCSVATALEWTREGLAQLGFRLMGFQMLVQVTPSSFSCVVATGLSALPRSQLTVATSS